MYGLRMYVCRTFHAEFRSGPIVDLRETGSGDLGEFDWPSSILTLTLLQVGCIAIHGWEGEQECGDASS